MPSSPAVLIYGQDQQLLDTRQWILEGAGYRVWSRTEISGIAHVIAYHQIDLLILCHSLSRDECESALVLARYESPLMKTLVLTADQCEYQAKLTSEVLDIRQGPTKLIAEVGKLIPCESTAYSHHY
jgi:hypothetical protein